MVRGRRRDHRRASGCVRSECGASSPVLATGCDLPPCRQVGPSKRRQGIFTAASFPPLFLPHAGDPAVPTTAEWGGAPLRAVNGPGLWGEDPAGGVCPLDTSTRWPGSFALTCVHAAVSSPVEGGPGWAPTGCPLGLRPAGGRHMCFPLVLLPRVKMPVRRLVGVNTSVCTPLARAARSWLTLEE